MGITFGAKFSHLNFQGRSLARSKIKPGVILCHLFVTEETQVRSCYHRMFAVIHLPKVPTIFKPSPCDLSVVRGDLQTNSSVEICGSSSKIN
ncbi:DNA primase large subunit-like [Vespula squamosa]|uniref:DNA primase large subunit-like n=1 Tax=Vespula squamosa TaxID=30214 RepID=A0ABD2AP22_VESSQ